MCDRHYAFDCHRKWPVYFAQNAGFPTRLFGEGRTMADMWPRLIDDGSVVYCVGRPYAELLYFRFVIRMVRTT